MKEPAILMNWNIPVSKRTVFFGEVEIIARIFHVVVQKLVIIIENIERESFDLSD